MYRIEKVKWLFYLFVVDYLFIDYLLEFVCISYVHTHLEI